MSLKGFHMVFITFSIILTLGFGLWAINNYGQPPTLGLQATAAGSFVVATALSFYFVYFIRTINTKV